MRDASTQPVDESLPVGERDSATTNVGAKTRNRGGEQQRARRTVGLGTLAAVIAVVAVISAGSAFAVVYTSTEIGIRDNGYTLFQSSTNNFPSAPAVSIGTDTGGTCQTTSNYYGSNNGAIVQMNSTGSCAVGNWAMILSFPGGSNLETGTDVFTFTVSYAGTFGGSYEFTATDTVSVTTGSTTGTDSMVLDWGQVTPPASVQSLSIEVTGT